MTKIVDVLIWLSGGPEYNMIERLRCQVETIEIRVSGSQVTVIKELLPGWAYDNVYLSCPLALYS
jgi:hypothetical protein